ncbi:AhpC/TSA antioxidant enzyme-domain-containing protein [Auriculariales sp. MPI-PUGE-AT-0066]|nr:AhpC/TSA antioxidant enzyme-domain-containing protein [Auriculariales sp. MPI-PUGE-AT-0066]
MANAVPDTTTLTAEQLSVAAQLSVLDGSGKPVRFGTLYEDQRTLVVFIRHFWCPSCRDYVTQLGKIPVDAFTEAGVRLVVIGCGDPSMIKNYKEATRLQHDMYADPLRKLYDALGTHTSLEKAPITPTYGQDTGILSSIKAIWKEPMLKPTVIGKQGKLDQLGADLILGPGQTCHYTRRMKNTQDHTPVTDLMSLAGLNLPPPSSPR